MDINDDFKEAMSLIPTSVGVVWLRKNHAQKIGCTISSFISVSVSLGKEKIAFVLRNNSRTAQNLANSEEFHISILDKTQHEVAKIFASGLSIEHLNQSLKNHVDWREGAICEFSLKINRQIQVDDSTIFVARVKSFLYRPSRLPLVYSSRKYD